MYFFSAHGAYFPVNLYLPAGNDRFGLSAGRDNRRKFQQRIQFNKVFSDFYRFHFLISRHLSAAPEEPCKDIDQDTLEYLNELREKIVELLTTVFLFLTNHNQTNVFSPSSLTLPLCFLIRYVILLHFEHIR